MENRTDWLNPLNRIRWQKAFKDHATEVTLEDGRKFTIDYDIEPGKVWVNIASDKEFAPCGWFNLKEVLDSNWVHQTTHTVGAPRQRSVYGKHLKEFLESDVEGISIIDEWPELESKKIETLKLAFKREIANLNNPKSVTIHINDKKIYLIKSGKHKEVA